MNAIDTQSCLLSFELSQSNWYNDLNLTRSRLKGNTDPKANVIFPKAIVFYKIVSDGICASPLFLQTLGLWFPNEMQNLLSSEKRTLDH